MPFLISILLFFSTIFFTSACWSAFNNFNTILIGEKSAGMGGAGTALVGDPSASSFYNPATLNRMEGRNLSASANLYNKIDTKYGDTNSTLQAAERINQGSFRSIPTASGSILSYGRFALGLSIVVPDYDYFAGYLKNTTDTKTTLQIVDESLWIGGTLSMNVNADESVGLTLYYTSRFYQRTARDELLTSAPVGAFITTESISHSENSIVYILGYYNQLSEKWGFGFSIRPPSVEVSGRGQIFRSTINTPVDLQPSQLATENIKSESRIPLKAAIGFTFTPTKTKTLSLDISYYGEEHYKDIENDTVALNLGFQSVVNANLGYETHINRWLRWRVGLFTNFSSHPEIHAATKLRGDHIDMWGVATNFAIFTEDRVSVVLGGNWTGGSGSDVQKVGQTLQEIAKSKQNFSLQVGSAFYF